MTEYTFSKSALKHTDRPYYNSVITQQNIVDIGLAEYETPSRIKYVVPGYFEGEDKCKDNFGMFELVIDIKVKKIFHFVFKGIKK